MKKILALAAFVVWSSTGFAQGTPPTQAEIEQWKRDPASNILETSPCKQITWLLDSERNGTTHDIQHSLGWWGRGFIEGAVYMKGDNAQKKARDFGLSVDVVAAHLQTYCVAHPTETPFDGVQDLVLKVLK